MGWRFRKSVGLGRGFRLNFSGSGISMSGGVKGVRLSVPLVGKRRRATATMSIPGSGLYYQTTVGGSARRGPTPAPPPPPPLVSPSPDEEDAIRDHLFKVAFDRAAEGQPKEMRELMACIIITLKQHPNWSTETMMASILSHFSDVTEQQLNLATGAVNDEFTAAREEYFADEEAKIEAQEIRNARFEKNGERIGKFVGFGLSAWMLWSLITLDFSTFFALIILTVMISIIVKIITWFTN